MEKFNSKTEALKREQFIKLKKSRKYIENLISRGRAAAAREAHNLEDAGSNPAPATD